MSHGNLPGPRANLELGAAFASAVAGRPSQDVPKLWGCCIALAKMTSAPNTAGEFLPFCGVSGLAMIGRAPAYPARALARLKTAALDHRWRVREAVVLGLQANIAAGGGVAFLHEWLSDGDPLLMRAVAATTAEPALLKQKEVADEAMLLHREILKRVPEARSRSEEGFRVLRQTLGYSISVVTAALPDEGFRLLRKLAESRDGDMLWICRENLKKSRLTSRFPEQVKQVSSSLKGP